MANDKITSNERVLELIGLAWPDIKVMYLNINWTKKWPSRKPLSNMLLLVSTAGTITLIYDQFSEMSNGSRILVIEIIENYCLINSFQLGRSKSIIWEDKPVHKGVAANQKDFFFSTIFHRFSTFILSLNNNFYSCTSWTKYLFKNEPIRKSFEFAD